MTSRPPLTVHASAHAEDAPEHHAAIAQPGRTLESVNRNHLRAARVRLERVLSSGNRLAYVAILFSIGLPTLYSSVASTSTSVWVPIGMAAGSLALLVGIAFLAYVPGRELWRRLRSGELPRWGVMYETADSMTVEWNDGTRDVNVRPTAVASVSGGRLTVRLTNGEAFSCPSRVRAFDGRRRLHWTVGPSW